MLLGRASECGRIADLLDEACAGRGGVLVIRGEPGIGKSALLEFAADRAGDARVLRASGIESEAELPFAALHELLAPVLDRLERIPRRQADALTGALALGPAVPGDRFAVAVGTLNVLASVAAEEGLVLVCDDAQWFDRSSAEALVFAARRLHAEGVAALFAVRDGLQSALDQAGLPELRLTGLDGRASRELLELRVGTVAPSVAERILAQAEGNPLALSEIPRELSAEQLAGAEPLPEPLPPGLGLAQAFRRRVAELPADAARALLFAAASHSAALEPLRRVLADEGLDPEALDAAEAAGLVETTGGRLAWRHPLVRSAVYLGSTPAQRRAVHRALADADDDSGRRAWHLAAAAEGHDDAVAELLERAAADARLRRAHAAAADALVRAAELTSDDEHRARRLLEAGGELQIVGRFEQAHSVLERAAHLADDPALHARIQHLRGSLQLWGGDRLRAHALLLESASQLEPIDPAAAVGVLIDVALAHQMEGDVPGMTATVRRAVALADRSESPETIDVAPLLINARILGGEANAVREELDTYVGSYAEGDEAGKHLYVPVWLGHALSWLDEYDEARAFFQREVEAARASGSLWTVPFSLACLAEVDFRAGRWDACNAGITEAVRLAEDTAQRNLLSFCLVTLARLEAGRGDADACRAHVRDALELAIRLGVGSIRAYALSASGLLELGLGRASEAVSVLERQSTLIDRQGLREPGVIHWRADLVEAYALVGRGEDARRELAALDEEAERTGRTSARASAERCRGVLDDEYEPAFARAVELFDELPMPFERARTQLRLGARLRRAKRAVEAREPLRLALDVFESIGAVTWAEQARTELAASGERVREPVDVGLRTLTPQELRVALLVADGATNRQAATALFLSPKTVGYHLGKVYEKLGINSRAQLAALVARTDAVAGQRSLT